MSWPRASGRATSCVSLAHAGRLIARAHLAGFETRARIAAGVTFAVANLAPLPAHRTNGRAGDARAHERGRRQGVVAVGAGHRAHAERASVGRAEHAVLRLAVARSAVGNLV